MQTCPWLLPRGPGPQAPRGQLSGEPEDGLEDGPNSEPSRQLGRTSRSAPLPASLGLPQRQTAHCQHDGPPWPRESRGEQEEVSSCVGPRALGMGAGSMGRGMRGPPISSINALPLPPAVRASWGPQQSALPGAEPGRSVLTRGSRGRKSQTKVDRAFPRRRWQPAARRLHP